MIFAYCSPQPILYPVVFPGGPPPDEHLLLPHNIHTLAS